MTLVLIEKRVSLKCNRQKFYRSCTLTSRLGGHSGSLSWLYLHVAILFPLPATN